MVAHAFSSTQLHIGLRLVVFRCLQRAERSAKPAAIFRKAHLYLLLHFFPKQASQRLTNHLFETRIMLIQAPINPDRVPPPARTQLRRWPPVLPKATHVTYLNRNRGDRTRAESRSTTHNKGCCPLHESRIPEGHISGRVAEVFLHDLLDLGQAL